MNSMILLSISTVVIKIARHYPVASLSIFLLAILVIFYYRNIQYGWKEGGKPVLIGLTKWFVAPILIILTIIYFITFLVNSNSTVFYEKAKRYMKSDQNLKQSAFDLFTHYIDDNPETDSAYYYRAMCFLDSYEWSNRLGFKTLIDFNATVNHLPAEYTFKNAISDLRIANSHNNSIQVSNQINSAIFKSIILSIENFNPAILKNPTKINYFQDISQEELDGFYVNLKTADYSYVPYDALLTWTSLSMENPTADYRYDSDGVEVFYTKYFTNNSQFLLNCWNMSWYRVKSDFKRIVEFSDSHNLRFKQVIKPKYCAVVENGNDTIHIPIDSIGLQKFAETKFGGIQKQLIIQSK